MIRRMRTVFYQTQIPGSADPDGLGERVAEYADAGTIDIAIAFASGGRQASNNVLTVNSTHTGVTYIKGVLNSGMRLRDGADIYRITYVNPDHSRMDVAYLERVSAVGR